MSGAPIPNWLGRVLNWRNQPAETEPVIPAEILLKVEAIAGSEAARIDQAFQQPVPVPEKPVAVVQSMPRLDLVRVLSNAKATFGVLISKGRPFAVTLEKPWRDNKPQVSCIPAGTYLCKRVQSPKFGNTFEITGVVGRSEILFHKGNVETDSLGCVLVAESFEDWKDGRPSIANSAQGFAQFLNEFAGVDEFLLTVWPAPL